MKTVLYFSSVLIRIIMLLRTGKAVTILDVEDLYSYALTIVG